MTPTSEITPELIVLDVEDSPPYTYCPELSAPSNHDCRSGAFVADHETPKSVETNTRPPCTPALRHCPDALIVTELHWFPGAPDAVHVHPKSLDSQILLSVKLATTRYAPELSIATDGKYPLENWEITANVAALSDDK